MTTYTREELAKAIQLVKPALSAQAFIPSLTHLCFQDGVLIAYNDVSAIQVKLPDAEGEHLECCIPGDLLSKALNNFTASQVTFKEGAGENDLSLKSGRANLKMHTLPLDSFPLKWPEKKMESITLTKDILNGIALCLLSVGSDPTHPAQMGVSLGATDSGAPVLYSTDNFTISRYEAAPDDDFLLDGNDPLLLPTFFCEQILALSKAFEGDVVLHTHKGALTASIGKKAKVFTKLLVDVDVPDFEQKIAHYFSPKKVKNLGTEIPVGLEAALSRALLILSDRKDKFTTVKCEDGELHLLSKSDLGVAEDKLETKADDRENFIIDPTMLQRIIRVTGHFVMLDDVLVAYSSGANFIHMISHCAA